MSKQWSVNMFSYPENLLNDLGLVNLYWGGVYTPLSDDQADGLQYVLQSALSGNERSIIIERYEDCKSYRAIAEEYSVTSERIRCIVERAKRKMSRLENVSYIVDGVQGVRRKKQEAQKKARKSIEEIIALAEKKSGVPDLRSLSVNEIGLSKRSSNALERSGVNKFSDLVEIIVNRPKDYKRIRNIGTKLRQEIYWKIEQYGVEIKTV